MGYLEDRDLSGVPTIPEFYKGKTIFVTGGTGFMGKVLIEKLLYSCSQLDRIYLLIRNKKGVKAEDRLAQLYSAPCFQRLKDDKPGLFESKVFIVAGDVTEPGLGLSDEDRTLLINRVDVVFHVAASVRFNDPLPYAVKMNLRGTIELVELAKEMRNLVSFIYVSTSYANTNRDPIEEIMYPPHADYRDTLAVCDNIDEHTLKILTPKYLGELPNTYVFTKQLAEHVIYENRHRLPAVIFRPSIVISSMEEPMPGWIDNFNGPVGILVASGKGIMRTIYSNPDIICDYMPVDISIKSLIVASWIRGTKSLEPTDDITIINCCSGETNYISNGELLTLGIKQISVCPFNGLLWYPSVKLSPRTINYILLYHQQMKDQNETQNLPVIFTPNYIGENYLGSPVCREPTDDVTIYNCCSGGTNTITMGETVEVGRNLCEELPMGSTLWYPGGGITISKTTNYILVILLQLLPAILVDTVLWVLGHKPLLVKVQRRIYIANQALEYYVTQQWTFDNKNLLRLRSSVKKEDLKDFYFKMEEIDKDEFYFNAVLGGRRYLMHEKDEDIPKARAHYMRMKILHYVVKYTFWVLMMWWFYNLKFVQNVLSNHLHLI